MEYIKAVHGVLLYGNLLMQSCGEDTEKKICVVEAINEILKEVNNERKTNAQNRQEPITDSYFSNEVLQKLMSIKQ